MNIARRQYLRLLLLAAICGLVAAPRAHGAFGDLLAKIVPADAGDGDHFSHAVAIDGNHALATARFHNHDGFTTGAAYLFSLDAPQSLVELRPSQVRRNHDFGASASLDGGRALIGAAGDDDAGMNAGAAYLFDFATGQQLRKLTPNDGFQNGNFGWSAALRGDYALVSTRQDSFAGSNFGSAYLFHAGTGQQLSKLVPDERRFLERFGQSVAMDGSLAVVGAPSYFSPNAGAVYVYDAPGGAQLRRLVPDDGVADQRFGDAVAMSGHLALIGAPGDNVNGNFSGSAYLFDVATGQQLRKFVPSNGQPGDAFGLSVALAGDLALIGAWNAEYQGIRSGAAYLFDVVTGQQLAQLGPNDGMAAAHFGFSVALSDDRALVGARDDRSGSAYLFDVFIPEPSCASLALAAWGALVAAARRRARGEGRRGC